MVLTFPLSALQTGSACTSSFACAPIEVELEVTTKGVAHAVAFWYRIHTVDPECALQSEEAIASAMQRKEILKVKEKKKNKEKEMDKDKDKGGTEQCTGRETSCWHDSRMFSSSNFPYCLDTGPAGMLGYRENKGEDGRQSDGGYGARKSEGESGGGCSGYRNRNNDNSHNHKSEKYHTHSGMPSHYRQAAALLDPPVLCSKGEGEGEGEVICVEVGIDLAFGVLCRVLQ